MGKRFWSVALSIAVLGGLLTALPAQAQAPAAVPATVQIDDPKGDANALNDQDNAYGTPLEGEGDHADADVGTATDIMRVWFSNTAADVSLNIELEGNPANLAYDTYFRFSSNAGEGSVANDTTRGCLQWIASINGTAGAYTGPTEGNLTDKCNVGGPVMGPLVISETPDKTFVVTVTFPRSYSKLLADGGKITAPFGVSRILYANGLPTTPANGSSAAFVTMDNTKRGTDYAIASGSAPPPAPPTAAPGEEPPGHENPPGKGKKKGCSKGKGKKKGACGAPVSEPVPSAPAQCPAYTPGEEGKEAASTVVTDAATADKPVIVELDAEAGFANDLGLAGGAYDQTTSVFQNIQVDSASASAGLYAKLSFSAYHDYDLYLNYADGSTAASSGDFNIAPGEGVGTGAPEGAWEAGNDHEQVNGIKTADCAGYTAKMTSYLTSGGKITLSLWLGEGKADPVPAEGGTLSMFYALMGL